MQHLLTSWKEIEPQLRGHTLLLFLDYDGTLTPIVKHPRLARLSSKGKKILRQLVLTRDVKTAIVSGRPLTELKDLIDLPGLIYVGNHGLELEGPKLRFTHPGALQAKPLIKKLRDQLKRSFKSFPGIFVEDKTLTLSIHYRQLSPEKVKPARETLSKVLGPHLLSSALVLTEGKKVWEIRPSVRWNKGTMALWLYGRVLAHSTEKVLPIYVGDDRTDEDAFQALKDQGIGVKVLEAESELGETAYSVRSPEEVFDFLERLIAIKGKEVRSKNYGKVATHPAN